MKTRSTYFIFFLALFLSGHIRPINTSGHSLNNLTTSANRCYEHYPEFQANLNARILIGDLISNFEEDDENDLFTVKKKPSVSCIDAALNNFVFLYGNPICSKQLSRCNCTSSTSKKYIFQRALKI